MKKVEKNITAKDGPKRQHYVTRSYQEFFSRNSEHLWVFDREKLTYRCDAASNIAVENHFYTFIDEDGNRRFDVEKMFSQIEGLTKPVIKKISLRETLTDQEKDILSAFAAASYLRTPDHLESINNVFGETIKKIGKMIYKSEDDVEKLLMSDKTELSENLTAKKLFDFVHSEKYEVKVHKNWSLSMMLKLLPEISKLIFNMSWIVAHTKNENKAFVTSDVPVSIISGPSKSRSFEGVGFATPGAIKAFPLTSSTCLLILDRGHEVNHIDLDSDTVRKINLSIVANCKRYVIGRDEKLIRSLVTELAIDKSRWQSKLRVS